MSWYANNRRATVQCRTLSHFGRCRGQYDRFEVPVFYPRIIQGLRRVADSPCPCKPHGQLCAFVCVEVAAGDLIVVLVVPSLSLSVCETGQVQHRPLVCCYRGSGRRVRWTPSCTDARSRINTRRSSPWAKAAMHKFSNTYVLPIVWHGVPTCVMVCAVMRTAEHQNRRDRSHQAPVQGTIQGRYQRGCSV